MKFKIAERHEEIRTPIAFIWYSHLVTFPEGADAPSQVIPSGKAMDQCCIPGRNLAYYLEEMESTPGEITPIYAGDKIEVSF